MSRSGPQLLHCPRDRDRRGAEGPYRCTPASCNWRRSRLRSLLQRANSTILTSSPAGDILLQNITADARASEERDKELEDDDDNVFYDGDGGSAELSSQDSARRIPRRRASVAAIVN